MAAERKHAHNAKDIREHFEAYRAAREARGIVDEDVWNMDETGFRIGCGRAHWVVSGHSREPLLLTDPDNREYVTSCECISAGGRDIPLMVIIAGVLILEKWAQQNDLNDDVLLTTSPTGYSNDDLAIDWLKYFDKHRRKGQVGAWRMLIMDGYGSHMTYEFFTYAKRNQIELFRLPPHSTHLTQPLDVGCFQPFKHYHSEATDELVRLGGADFDKLDFLSIFQRMRNQTFTSATILSSFGNTGLVPYNPDVVIRKLKAIQTRRPATPPPPSSAPLLARTPRTTKEVVEYGMRLRMSLAKYKVLDNEWERHVGRFVKGSISSAHARQIVERDLLASHQQSVAKAARKKLDGKVAQKGGVITVGDIRAKTSKRCQNEVEMTRLAYEWAPLAAERSR